MPESSHLQPGTFSAGFPDRFDAAIGEARGALAGLAGAGGPSTELIGTESLRRLHGLFRVRVELELEVAGMLWRTAELVRALADTTDALVRRRAGAARPVEGIVTETTARAAGPTFSGEFARRRAAHPGFNDPATVTPEPVPAVAAGGFGQGSGQLHHWPAQAAQPAPRREPDQALWAA